MILMTDPLWKPLFADYRRTMYGYPTTEGCSRVGEG